jgi:hypothetical protein
MDGQLILVAMLQNNQIHVVIILVLMDAIDIHTKAPDLVHNHVMIKLVFGWLIQR